MQDTELALLVDRFMRRIHFGLQSKADEFDTERVGPGGGIILLTLHDLGCCPLNELTRRVARDKSQMSRSIRSLEGKGLVQSHPSPDDARVRLISLTDQGQTVVRDLQIAVAETIDDILSPIRADEKVALKSLLERAVGQDRKT